MCLVFHYRCSSIYDGLPYDISALRRCVSDTHNGRNRSMNSGLLVIEKICNEKKKQIVLSKPDIFLENSVPARPSKKCRCPGAVYQLFSSIISRERIWWPSRCRPAGNFSSVLQTYFRHQCAFSLCVLMASTHITILFVTFSTVFSKWREIFNTYYKVDFLLDDYAIVR